MLKNELPFSWGLALSVTFAIFWRWWLISIIPGILIDAIFYESFLLLNILHIVLSFVALIIAVKWLFRSGRVASMKITFMEQAHYQEMTSNN